MKKRVTHIIDGLSLGGAERVLQSLAVGMQEQYEVEVITLSRIPLEGQEIAIELLEAGISVTHIPKKSKWAGSTFTRLVNHLQSTNPDIVHTHLFAADVWGARAAYRAHVPVIISTEHNINNDEGVLKERLKCKTHKLRDSIIAISESVEQYIAHISPEMERNIQLIPNGIDYLRFEHIGRERKESSEPSEQLQLAIVGRLAEQKGHIQALEILAQIDIDYHLNIVGEGNMRGAILRTIQELGMEERVTIQPAREDIENVYAAADIVLVPSVWEGFGLVAVEAMASGCIVIASPVDGLSEIISHEENGFLVDMSDPQALQATLQIVQTDPERSGAIRQNAITTVQQHYTREAMVEQYIGLYESFLISDA